MPSADCAGVRPPWPRAPAPPSLAAGQRAVGARARCRRTSLFCHHFFPHPPLCPFSFFIACMGEWAASPRPWGRGGVHSASLPLVSYPISVVRGKKEGHAPSFFFFLPLEFLRGNSSLTPPLTFFSVCFCSPRWPGLPPPHHHTPRPLQRGRGAGRMFWCRACARFVCFVFFMRGEVLRMDGWERWAFPARPPVRRPSPPSLDACPTHPLCNTRHFTNPLCA